MLVVTLVVPVVQEVQEANQEVLVEDSQDNLKEDPEVVVQEKKHYRPGNLVVSEVDQKEAVPVAVRTEYPHQQVLVCPESSLSAMARRVS